MQSSEQLQTSKSSNGIERQKDREKSRNYSGMVILYEYCMSDRISFTPAQSSLWNANCKEEKIFWFDDGYSYVYLAQGGNILHEATDLKIKHEKMNLTPVW